MIALLALVLAAAAPPGAAPSGPTPAGAALFDPATGYRVDRYRAPVPDAPPGVRRVEVDEVRALLAQGAAVIDVMPVRAHGWDPATGRWLLGEPHLHVPGTRWYPETGRGVLDPVIAAWFAHEVAAVTHGDRAAPVVTYCLADCWMSWNAAKRLREWGYADVRWFATGADGWRDAGLPLETAEPEPVR